MGGWTNFRTVYELAYDRGLKGCTTFRLNPVTGTVLTEEAGGAQAPHCCILECEPD
jgi:ribonucleoside-diphosphate reductase alpha chain